MRQLLLLLFFVFPFVLFAQNAESEALMEKMGYKKVDLEALSKQQLQQKPCSTCPHQAVLRTEKSTVLDTAHEISKLEQQIPALEQKIKALKADPNADPNMLQKYQTALANNKQRIKELQMEQAKSANNKTSK